MKKILMMVAMMASMIAPALASTSKVCSYNAQTRTRTCVVKQMGTFIIHDTKTVLVQAPAAPVVVVEKPKLVFASPAPDLRPHLDITGIYDTNTGNFKPYTNGGQVLGTLTFKPGVDTDVFVQGGVGRFNDDQKASKLFSNRDFSFTTYKVGFAHRLTDNVGFGASFAQKPTDLMFVGSPKTFHQVEVTATLRVF